MANAYANIIENPAEMPEWLTDGLTMLLPKMEERKNPKNYSPITCLPTMSKVFSSTVAERTYLCLSEHQLLLSEQEDVREEAMAAKTNIDTWRM